MAELEEGGMFDEETMPDWMKTMRGVALSRPSHSVPVSFQDTVIQGLPPGNLSFSSTIQIL